MFLYKYVIKKEDLCFLGFFAPWKDEKFHKIDVSLPEICSHSLNFFSVIIRLQILLQFCWIFEKTIKWMNFWIQHLAI